jgi:putative hydrolase of the HAD superfamily
MTPTITAIAFDWGGIFTENTFDSSAVRDLAARSGLSEAHIAKTYFPLMEHFEAGAFDFDTFAHRFIQESGVELSSTSFRETFLGAVREREAMFRVLSSIPAHYTVGVLSNNVEILCDQVRGDPRMARVEHFVFSNEIRVRKPDPAAFAALTEALGRPPQETVFVDDNADNIAACEALGYQGLLLESYGGFAERWQRLLPDLPLP